MSFGPHNPWEREPKKPPCSAEVIKKLENSNPTRRNFNVYPQNMHLDIYTKMAALKASSSVVSLESHSGEEEIRQCSGFIIENVNTSSIVLTSASLLKCFTSRNFEVDDIKVTVHLSDGRSFDGQIEAYDFHYNIAAIMIESDTPLPTASLTQLKDAITVDPHELDVNEDLVPDSNSFDLVPGDQIQLKDAITVDPHELDVNEDPHELDVNQDLVPDSNSYDLVPGDLVIALGRFIEPYDIMAAPGEFSIDRCKYDCKELFKALCRISECGIGGPLINCNGEVIGICLHSDVDTAFLPINIASIWWEHYKKYRQLRRPWLGMEVTNLYAAPVQITERIIRKFPDILKGVIVEKVVPGSSAESAGIKHGDVIIQFGGKRIQSLLELFESAWNKVRESVEVTVIRASNDGPLHLSMVVNEATSE